MLDIALLVPFQPRGTSWVDPVVRSAHAASKLVALRARDRLYEHLGVSPSSGVREETRERSLTAVALSTSLERAGLSWRTLDPGPVGLQEWRRLLTSLRADPPRLIAISSTFVNDGYWLGSLCALVRQVLPDSRIAVGGYYYATSAKEFLALDADILCVGEGEVRIVTLTEAVRDGRPLDAIAGLYVREGSKVRYTGDVEPLHLDEVPLPDWSLSTRIEPPIDRERHRMVYHVETQRGCVFKCQFCTFRTLAAPVLATVDRGVAAILDAARGKGTVWVVDATATYPRDRWRKMLEVLVERGGSPLPVHAYARVTDLDDEVCALMARAGVRYVLIGQESGDQRILNAIRKGTRVADLRPAIAALGRHGIEPALSFLYGFPGETVDSLATTRRLIATLNDGHESRPVVRRITVEPFAAQDFAGVRQNGALGDSGHRYGWDGLAISPLRAAEEALSTYIELSRIPHAPITSFNGIVPMHQFVLGKRTGNDLAYFRWAKAIDRGIGIFAAEETEGKKPNRAELRSVRDEILERLPDDVRHPSQWQKLFARAKNRATWLVLSEWARETTSDVGPLTRLALAVEVARDTGRPDRGLSAIVTGRYPELGFVSRSEADDRSAAADQLVKLGVATGARRLARAE